MYNEAEVPDKNLGNVVGQGNDLPNPPKKKVRLPSNIDFTGIKPLGYQAERKTLIQTPSQVSGTSTYKPGQTVNFVINGNEGFWDPYATFIRIRVQTSKEMKPRQILQLDGSGQSLIAELNISSRGTVLENIQEYDSFASLQYDMNMGVEARQSCGAQGCGWGKAGFMKKGRPHELFQQNIARPWHETFVQNISTVDECDNVANVTDKYDMDEYNFRIEDIWGSNNYKYHPGIQRLEDPLEGVKNLECFPHSVTTHPNPNQNPLTDNWHPWGVGEKFLNHDNIPRDQTFVKKPRAPQNLIDEGLSFSTSFCNSSFEPQLSGSKLTQKGMIDGKPYQGPVTSHEFTIPLNSGILGILMPQSSYKLIPMNGIKDLNIVLRLSEYAFFSSGRYTQDGTDTDDFVYDNTQMGWHVKYPSLEENVGDNINKMEWKNYYDGKMFVLKDVFEPSSLLQMALGPEDLQYSRIAWEVTKIELQTDIITFGEQIELEIQRQLASPNGIMLHSSTITTGPAITFQAGQSPHGNYTINQGFESLRSMFMVFQPLDYDLYDYCRKQFRISHNLSALQVRVGTEYIPSVPITGHAGNTMIDPNAPERGDNSIFFYNCKKSWGKQNEISSEIMVDEGNFSVNDRLYNPEVSGPYWKIGTKDKRRLLHQSMSVYVCPNDNGISGDLSSFITPLYSNIANTVSAETKIIAIKAFKGDTNVCRLDNGSVQNAVYIHNNHTARGLPLYFENACVGKAAYGLDFESLSEADNLIAGLNTVNRQPYTIMLKSHKTSSIKEQGGAPKNIQFPRKSRMLVFHYHDIILTMGNVGINVIGS